jgi:hypothetical protein
MKTGPKDPVIVNFYEFNACEGVDVAGFVNAVWCHEERGCNGGTGHQGLMELAAGEPQNDPYNAIEAFVQTDQAELRRLADDRLAVIAKDIIIRAGEPYIVRNWAGNILWFWNGTQYVETYINVAP